MKTKLILLMLLLASVVRAYPPAPATQAQVNAGTETYKYVTPATLAGWTGAAMEATPAAYVARNGITDPTAQVYLNRWWTAWGAYRRNICDAIICDAQFNFNSNSLFGRPLAVANAACGADWGLSLANSSVLLTNLPDLTNWVLCLDFDNPTNADDGTLRWLGGVGNVTSSNSVGLSAGGWLEVQANTNNLFWGDGLTNMTVPVSTFMGNNDPQFYAQHAGERYTLCLNYSNGLVNLFTTHAQASQFNFNTPNSNPLLVCTSSFNALKIGSDFMVASNISGVRGNMPFYGRFKCAVLLTNVAFGTNLAVAAEQAFQGLESDTLVLDTSGDSRFEANNYAGQNSQFTNFPTFYIKKKHPEAAHSTYNFGKGGSTIRDCLTLTNVLMAVPMIPGVAHQITDMHGINDIYSISLDGYVTYSNLLKLSRIYAGFNTRLHYITPFVTSPNVPVSIVTYNGSATNVNYTNYATFCRLVVSNYPSGFEVSRGDLVCNTNMMGTNSAFRVSDDGLHAKNVTNGWRCSMALGAVYGQGIKPNVSYFGGGFNIGGVLVVTNEDAPTFTKWNWLQ